MPKKNEEEMSVQTRWKTFWQCTKLQLISLYSIYVSYNSFDMWRFLFRFHVFFCHCHIVLLLLYRLANAIPFQSLPHGEILSRKFNACTLSISDDATQIQFHHKCQCVGGSVYSDCWIRTSVFNIFRASIKFDNCVRNFAHIGVYQCIG